jgi:HAD superfamily hydrolase (TIGR01549 family)
VKPRLALRAVLFDWDGTLVDSAAASFRCYAALFGSFGIAFGEREFERTYSPDWYRTYEAVGLPPARWPEADARWVELYARESSELLPGAAASLDRLRSAGLASGLVSSGGRERISRDLARFGLAGFFPVVVCGGETRNRKPHPEPLLRALDELGIAPGDAAYLGDSPEDVHMARAAGVFAVGIPGGFPNRSALAAAAPDLLASDLASALGRLLG